MVDSTKLPCPSWEKILPPNRTCFETIKVQLNRVSQEAKGFGLFISCLLFCASYCCIWNNHDLIGLCSNLFPPPDVIIASIRTFERSTPFFPSTSSNLFVEFEKWFCSSDASFSLPGERLRHFEFKLIEWSPTTTTTSIFIGPKTNITLVIEPSLTNSSTPNTPTLPISLYQDVLALWGSHRDRPPLLQLSHARSVLEKLVTDGLIFSDLDCFLRNAVLPFCIPPRMCQTSLPRGVLLWGPPGPLKTNNDKKKMIYIWHAKKKKKKKKRRNVIIVIEGFDFWDRSKRSFLPIFL